MDNQKVITSKQFNAKIQKAADKEILRTAAYCRVSTLQEEQELSYESQCAYYEKLITADPKKELVGVYGDQGISGLHAEGRPELQRMLQDCRDGKIDYVITKSISRFARNAIECQKMLDELNSLGIPVMFEKENVRSDNPQVTLIMKLLISTAQEESNSMSQAIKWSYDNNVKIGKPTRACPYGYKKKPRLKRTDPHIWEIYEPEAVKVRTAFQMIMDGCMINDVMAALTEMERKEGSDYEWKRCRVHKMLRNEAYKGDILSNKFYTPDVLSKHSKVNQGEREQFYLEGHHEPIIAPEVFDEVQIILTTLPKTRRKRGNEWKR